MTERCECVEHVGDRLIFAQHDICRVTRQLRRIDGNHTPVSETIAVWCETCVHAYQGEPFKKNGPWDCEWSDHEGGRAIAERLDVYRERLEFRRLDKTDYLKVEITATVCAACVSREVKRRQGIADEQGVLL